MAVEIPHPQPFSLKEKGVNLPSAVLGVRASLPSPLVGEGSGVRASLLSRSGRWARGEGISPLPLCSPLTL